MKVLSLCRREWAAVVVREIGDPMRNEWSQQPAGFSAIIIIVSGWRLGIGS
jgi:hypothetical protein